MSKIDHHPNENPSQAADILAALESGARLTQRIASRRFGCDRLGARIHELRQAGHEIVSERTPVRKGNGKTAYVATYFLEARS